MVCASLASIFPVVLLSKVLSAEASICSSLSLIASLANPVIPSDP